MTARPVADHAVNVVVSPGLARREFVDAKLAAIAAAASAYAAFGAYRVLNHQTACPLKAATGLDCPFCGGTRAVVALARGQLQRALDFNAFVCAAPLVIGAVVMAFAGRGRRNEARNIELPATKIFQVVIALAWGWAVIRNLGVVPWLASNR